MKYKKLPVPVDAFLLGVDDFPKWFAEAIIDGTVKRLNSNNYIISTLEGNMLARAGADYIIKGVDGELYPCKVDIFEKTYERV